MAPRALLGLAHDGGETKDQRNGQVAEEGQEAMGTKTMALPRIVSADEWCEHGVGNGNQALG